MKYFAYGSNMSLLRLRKRVPSANRLGLFYLEQHDLRFHKASIDGSAKCDAFQTRHPKDAVIGALFEIDKNEKTALDIAESLGCGYDEKLVNLSSESGDIVAAFTYCATKIDPSLKPYSWYLNHVVVGAKETGVPKEYLHKIQSVESCEDADLKRDAKQRAIYSK